MRSRFFRRTVILLLLTTLVGLCSCSLRREPSAPYVFAQDTTGKPIILSRISKSKTLVYFWASWCPMCKEALQAFQQRYPKFQEAGIGFVAVGLDQTLEHVLAVKTTSSLSYPIVADLDEALRRKYSVGMVPVLIVVNIDGEVLPLIDPANAQSGERVEGYRNWLSPEGQKALLAR